MMRLPLNVVQGVGSVNTAGWLLGISDFDAATKQRHRPLSPGGGRPASSYAENRWVAGLPARAFPWAVPL